MLCAALSAGAQTIADYSRAQRALIESAMTQSAARSVGLAASASAAPAAVATAATALPPIRPVLAPVGPVVQVSGVFAGRGAPVAEVLVNATAYLLGSGESVPGTRWQLESVAVDRVVLSRRDGAAGDPDGARKVFALPVLH